jgi:PAS domain S-box-containing protein
VIDESGKILVVNRAWREFAQANALATEVRVSEGLNYFSICETTTSMGAAKAAEFAAGIRAVISGDQDSFSLAYSCHTTTELRCFIGRATRFRGRGPTRLVVKHTDITETNRIAKSLRLNQAVLNSIPDPAWMKDANGRYLTVNQAWCDFTGHASESVTGKTDYDLLPVETADKFKAHDVEVLATQKPVSQEEFVVDCRGSGDWFETIKTPLFNDQGALIGTVGIARNISERKRFEELRQAAMRLQKEAEKLAATGRFAARRARARGRGRLRPARIRCRLSGIPPAPVRAAAAQLAQPAPAYDTS